MRSRAQCPNDGRLSGRASANSVNENDEKCSIFSTRKPRLSGARWGGGKPPNGGLSDRPTQVRRGWHPRRWRRCRGGLAGLTLNRQFQETLEAEQAMDYGVSLFDLYSISFEMDIVWFDRLDCPSE